MEKLQPQLAAYADKGNAQILSKILAGVYRRLNTCALTSAGLAIKAGSSALVKTGSTATTLSVEGVLVSIAASTDMPALVGTVTNATYNVFVFSVDKAGTAYVQMGTAAASLAGVKYPNVPDTRAVIGSIIVHPTGTGDFVGGTTALDNATVVPNVVYNNTVGASAPNASLV